jgi:hypothetical protein
VADVNAPEIDEDARALAVTRFALPLCLHIPIAAKDEGALQRFVGRIETVLTGDRPMKALLVRAYDLPEQDARLPIWEKPEAEILRQPTQVWVHVDCREYRRAYASAFPTQRLSGRVLDHVMNRRVARLKGFTFLRIVPISRGANSSSGGLVEKWAVAYHANHELAAAKTFIQYADLADIVKMLDMKTGGSLQDAVNDAQALVTPRSGYPA